MCRPSPDPGTTPGHQSDDTLLQDKGFSCPLDMPEYQPLAPDIQTALECGVVCMLQNASMPRSFPDARPCCSAIVGKKCIHKTPIPPGQHLRIPLAYLKTDDSEELFLIAGL